MYELPPPVWTHISNVLLTTRLPAYLALDVDHRLVNWGGQVRVYGLENLQRGQSVDEQVIVLQGLLPLQDHTLVLPWIEIQPGCYADIHLFTAETTIWVLFLNATVEATQVMRMQQKINEAELYWDRLH